MIVVESLCLIGQVINLILDVNEIEESMKKGCFSGKPSAVALVVVLKVKVFLFDFLKFF